MILCLLIRGAVSAPERYAGAASPFLALFVPPALAAWFVTFFSSLATRASSFFAFVFLLLVASVCE